mgnify:CR=1 FL=1
MKKNKMKTSHSSSFGRLWSYLQAYRFPLYLAIFLKIVSVIMSVLEPVVIGLAITELTKNTLDIMKGVEGAHINEESNGYGKRPCRSKSEYFLHCYRYDALSIPWGPL